MNQPVVLTTKTLLVFLLAAAILSAGVAVAVARLSDPGSAAAKPRANAATRELKKLNRRVGQTNRTLTGIQTAIGGQLDSSGSGLRRNTKETADNVRKLCLAITELPSAC
jgi:hypothetical protein